MLWKKAKDIEIFQEAAISVHVDAAAYYLEKRDGSERSNVNSLAASFFLTLLSPCVIFLERAFIAVVIFSKRVTCHHTICEALRWLAHRINLYCAMPVMISVMASVGDKHLSFHHVSQGNKARNVWTLHSTAELVQPATGLGTRLGLCDIRIHTKIQWRFFVQDNKLSIEKNGLFAIALFVQFISFFL